MAHILVTGASGFIGLAVTRALLARGDRVSGFDAAISPGLAALAGPALAIVPGEITEWPALAQVFARDKPDAVIHCAAIVGVPLSARAPITTVRVNIEGALNVLEAMRLFGTRRMIHLSSEETYGAFTAGRIDETHPQNPTMPYGITKLAVEHLARSHALLHETETIHIRTSWVYGPNFPRLRVPRVFIDKALAEEAYQLAGGADVRVDHTYIDDLVAGLLGALDLPTHPHDAYNMASGNAPSFAEMAHMVNELVPGARMSVGDGPFAWGDVDGKPLPAVRKGALDVGRAHKAFGYKPRFDLRAGLAETIARERANLGRNRG